MSPPRRSYGANPPGRVPAAMLRALAAELSDPGRFFAAKAYARDGAVVDIVVEPGAARGQIQGSRYEPYLAAVMVAPADDGEGLLGLVPERREIVATCTCPDADTADACKHTLAVLLVLADEVTLDTDVLTTWRSGRGASLPAPAVPDGDDDDERVDLLAPLLVAPAAIPVLPAVPTRLVPAMPAPAGGRDADVAAAVAAAITELRGAGRRSQ